MASAARSTAAACSRAPCSQDTKLVSASTPCAHGGPKPGALGKNLPCLLHDCNSTAVLWLCCSALPVHAASAPCALVRPCTRMPRCGACAACAKNRGAPCFRHGWVGCSQKQVAGKTAPDATTPADRRDGGMGGQEQRRVQHLAVVGRDCGMCERSDVCRRCDDTDHP
jgi:hypothetical protein